VSVGILAVAVQRFSVRRPAGCVSFAALVELLVEAIVVAVAVEQRYYFPCGWVGSLDSFPTDCCCPAGVVQERLCCSSTERFAVGRSFATSPGCWSREHNCSVLKPSFFSNLFVPILYYSIDIPNSI